MRPVVFPEPRRIELRDEPFVIDEEAIIVLPENPSDNDLFLARFLAAELVDRYHVALRTVCAEAPPAGKRWIAVGTIDNPLIKTIAAERGMSFEESNPGAEGYILDVSPEGAVVAGRDERGALYGLQSLRQLIAKEGDALKARGARITDWPRKPFRGLRILVPGKEHLPFFKRFLRDFALYFKYNALILEMNAAMRLDRHPELNAGWYELAKNLNYTRRDRPEGPGRQFQDSTHHDTGDFNLLEKDDVAEICRYARELGIDVFPELPSLTHAYYLLARHREFAEIKKAEWPDTYCPLVPEVYDLYFDVLEEYIEVMKPSIIHIGHDEWRMPMDVCERCRGKDYRKLFADDVTRIHGWLKERGIRAAMWGDHLLERVRQVEARPTKTPAGYEFNRPGALNPELVAAEIPKDILIFNWFWSRSEIGGEDNEIQLHDWGFEQVYGNFTPGIIEQDFGRRTERETILGAAASSWMRTDETNFAKSEVKCFIGVAGLLWSDRWLSSDELTPAVQEFMPIVRQYLRRAPSPGEDGEPVTTIDISSACNASLARALPDASVELKRGEVAFDWKKFILSGGGKSVLAAVGTKGEGEVALPPSAEAIAVDEDVSSLLFLHACVKPAQNLAGHFVIYNFEDCADLLGWYEIEYEDGFVVNAPVRYGVNILEWNWASDGSGQVCWQADPIDCSAGGAPVSFFAWEWKNPRFGKAISTVTLKGSHNFTDAHRKPIASNGVMLAALSKIPKRPAPISEYAGEDY